MLVLESFVKKTYWASQIRLGEPEEARPLISSPPLPSPLLSYSLPSFPLISSLLPEKTLFKVDFFFCSLLLLRISLTSRCDGVEAGISNSLTLQALIDPRVLLFRI